MLPLSLQVTDFVSRRKSPPTGSDFRRQTQSVTCTGETERTLEWECPGCNIEDETDGGLLTVSNTITFTGSVSFNGSRVAEYVHSQGCVSLISRECEGASASAHNLTTKILI